MNIVCVGGGPGGLLFAILSRLADDGNAVEVRERNRADDPFGFGVVFSDETLTNLRGADPATFARIEAEMRYWTEIDIDLGGRLMRSGGHGFAALERRRLLAILSERAVEVGVRVRYSSTSTDLARLRAEHDLVVATDGVNSQLRAAGAAVFQPVLEVGSARYVWLATTHCFERFSFIFRDTEAGPVQAHAYPYSDGMASFIVEVEEATWQRTGLDDRVANLAPGASDPSALAFAERVFARDLAGHGVIGNNSRWMRFTTVSNRTWRDGNVVLLGDAAHTAHFSVGSGTKLAMEDAISLASALRATASLDDALVAYETERRPLVESTQRAARTSQEWFEGVRRYLPLAPENFAFQLMTRSQRITFDNLRMRDTGFVDRSLHSFWGAAPQNLRPENRDTPPLFYPFQLRDMRLLNRVVVSSMAQYSAEDGVPDDWHLVHLGSRAVGGAGLVMTEMTCVSPEGRITPGCTGLWNDTQESAWQRIVVFVHENSQARIGLQLGHSGRKGSTKAMWEGDDIPLDDGNWRLLAPSPIPYRAGLQTPVEMTRADMEMVTSQFVRAAQRGAAAGFDLLELHWGHGYLLSSFLSPFTNRRADAYGGSPQARSRYPLEVLDAVRAVWPAARPMSVRISATDWLAGGFNADDACVLAAALRDHGCDIVDVSSGQVDPAEQPRHGRLWQTPFSDRIRQEVGIPTIAVGGIASVDDVNTILLAGRSDLVALARPHLVDPYWTLNAAIDLEYPGHRWPVQYVSGKTARRREQTAMAARERDAR
ncbi:MAG: bifunctional salicylyl-CoA 5-hydroxylase/oxidoreductase [Candidatus Dormibacteraeota bacterium]|uniref:Bifunctional salicylyl-CoA 5-hydroxylase/oxidoreductase n=1 Tax=Candidatus Aeolococcus gillhamiae TaxID=3127015 RepID=A0A934N5L0_9BACT|nr:bifunctional salicylyl-CoA 5-hydroxylase/oxidoreductase [Candidatus Dormibacteraeota bacterium]